MVAYPQVAKVKAGREMAHGHSSGRCALSLISADVCKAVDCEALVPMLAPCTPCKMFAKHS